MSVINAIPLFLGDEGYQISRSVRLRSSASAYFNRTPASAGNRKTWTWSAWVKRGDISTAENPLFTGYTDANNRWYARFEQNTLRFYWNVAATSNEVYTNAVFRDPSAWYHVVVAVDTTQATDSNRIKVYVNGVQQTLSGTYIPQNTDTQWNNNVVQTIGKKDTAGTYFDGYMTEVNSIDGQALTPASFGETNPVTGVWQPKKYAGTYGTNGFYLNFSDNTSPTNVITGNSGIGRDFSGNGNYWISNNVSLYGGTTQSFTSTGTTSWTAPAGVTSVQYLIVGGGGGGTNYSGGGGGSVVTGTMSVTPGSSYSVTVGAGGSGGVTPTDGADSAFAGVTATKGLKAASAYVGGASGSGFAGGTGANLANPYLGGGGGGAGGAGNNRSGTTAGAGGVGVSVTIGSTTSTYGGGGGGGAEGAGSRGLGGSGGGGNGSGPVGSPAGSAGTANTGGGGGGGDGGNTTSGFAGGSGTVILAYGSSATYDSMLDVPTQWADGGNGRGNYATLNPVANPSTLLNANLTTNAGDKFSISTIGMTTGKWYCEVTVTTVGAESSVGISTQPYSGSNPYVGGTSTSWGYYSNNGNKYTNASNAAYGATYTTGDVIGIAFDADNGTLEFFKNNTSQGTAYTGLTSGPYFFAVEGRTTTSANNCSINFGQRPFAYTPPTGFKALNTLNLPTPTILKGNQYFDATTYTGTGASLNVVNSGGMQPDFVWTKPRSTAVGHTLFDSVRGVTKYLQSNTTGAEGTAATSLTAFNSDGFTVNSDTSTGANGVTYVGWQWKEGATQGFDIVTYTGDGVARTIAHNLGVAPKMIIVKNRNTSSYGWFVWHTAFGAAGNTDYINLNLTDAKGSGGAVSMWNNTMPTSSVFSLGTYAGVNGNTNTYVAYLFSEVAGFSKFGSYTGNGSADGAFVFCGFRPRWVMIKRTDNVGDWWIHDSARDTYNVERNYLMANTSAAEAATDNIDFLSNGFKLRVATFQPNTNGGNFIFMAFAENPFKNALAR